jgi:hypothetical protein
MSFDLIQVHKLKATGGAVWDEYQRHVAACDASAYDSPAHRELGAFQKAWEADQQGTIAAAEAKVAQSSAPPEDAAQGRRRSRREQSDREIAS